MFCGNDDAVCRAAITYSLISSCKAVGIDPRTWMEDALKRLPNSFPETGNRKQTLSDSNHFERLVSSDDQEDTVLMYYDLKRFSE